MSCLRCQIKSRKGCSTPSCAQAAQSLRMATKRERGHHPSPRPFLLPCTRSVLSKVPPSKFFVDGRVEADVEDCEGVNCGAYLTMTSNGSLAPGSSGSGLIHTGAGMGLVGTCIWVSCVQERATAGQEAWAPGLGLLAGVCPFPLSSPASRVGQTSSASWACSPVAALMRRARVISISLEP